jgi:pyruvate ferredoxin oxidoreductase alpha subunit
MRRAKDVIADVGRTFAATFGRAYGFFDAYRLQDADVALVALSSTAGTARVAVDRLRREGLKVGLLKLRVFRPFPAAEIVAALHGVAAVGVMDRSISFGAVDNGGPLWLEIAAAARGLAAPVLDYVFGLGGRDITVPEIEAIYRHLLAAAENGPGQPLVHYVGVRGKEAFGGNGDNGERMEVEG